MSRITAINYNNMPVQFSKGSSKDYYVNATSMVKAFPEKRVNNFSRLKSTYAFIDMVSESEGIDFKKVMISHKGGNTSTSGTWMHKLLALEFARWLSPQFNFWLAKKLSDLDSKQIESEDQLISRALVVATKKLEQSKEKVDYYERVLKSESVYTMTQVSKALDMSAIALGKFLNSKNVLFKTNPKSNWVPYSKYQDKGYFKLETSLYNDQNGKEKTKLALRVTESGREFIYKLIEKQAFVN